MKESLVKEIIESNEGRVIMTWHETNELPAREQIMQSSGYIFDNEGKVLIVRDERDFWAVPGGHLDEGEHPCATFVREAFEEGCVVIEEPVLVGYEEVDFEATGEKIFQLRHFAKAKEVADFKPEFEIVERKFVAPEEIGNYINWWNKSKNGQAELAAALKYKDR